MEAAPDGLESALARTEADADAALKAAKSVTSTLTRLRTAARHGTLRELNVSLANLEAVVETLRQQCAATREGWRFDEQGYLAGGSFARELRATAERQGTHIYELDERLYSYPALVRVLPSDRAVLIDKRRERRLRPSVLAAHLKDLQQRPPRFRSDAFLRALYEAYTFERKSKGKSDVLHAGNARLIDLYQLFTLLPGTGRDYSVQEFGRDLYLLDQSGDTSLGNGVVASFAASTATKGSSRGVIRVISQRGEEKVYYAIAFSRAG